MLGGFGPADALGHMRGTTDQQAGTFMHELGHTLGLRHGGGDNFNCKPNYLSVMSYSRQFADFLTNRPLDYSHRVQQTLDETTTLSETLGIGVVDLGSKTVHSVPTALTPFVALLVPDASGIAPIDWNGDGVAAGSVAGVDTNKLLVAGCDGTGSVLPGYDDWSNLVFNARATVEFAGGVRSDNNTSSNTTSTEKTAEQELASFLNADRDNDGVPDAFACSGNKLPSSTPCVIDIKPGSNPKVISKGSTSNIQVAIRATADFDPSSQVIRESLTLNEVSVKLNNQNRGTCSTALNANGRVDLLCQFPVSALPLGTNFSILEGLAVVKGKTTAIRARDAVTVVK